jgi:predicted ribosome quality control (RQC) complex YloA/Tae2 family protein
VTTDWLIFRRAAAELDRALRGGRVTDCGLLEDGRFAVRFGGLRGLGRTAPPPGARTATLAVDVFGSPPLLALETEEPALAGDPGWTRAVSGALRGMRVLGVRARRGDRVVVVRFGTESRFGVASEVRHVLELVPRYGNVLLLRDGTVIAAAKQFSPAENEARSVQLGQPYLPPPLPEVRVPRLVHDAFVAQAAVVPDAQRERWIAGRESALLDATAGEPDGLGDVFVYRTDGRIRAAHVVALRQFGEPTEVRDALLPLLAEAANERDDAQAANARERERRALLGRIDKRRAAIERELAGLRDRAADADARLALRHAGERLYTYGHAAEPGATSFTPPDGEGPIELDPTRDSVANAQAYFARYRKATDALPHLERRTAELAARLRSLDELAFETTRAEAATLGEIAASLAELEGKAAPSGPGKPARGAARPRGILRIERPSGARIYVGRSPRENAEVTFKIARADDLWFHARNTPGSHVVLQTPDGAAPIDDDLDAAADLAAEHSKARTSPRVEIDYTERKHVRKQRDGAPGLVWYTNARTRVGRPLGSQAVGARSG